MIRPRLNKNVLFLSRAWRVPVCGWWDGLSKSWLLGSSHQHWWLRSSSQWLFPFILLFISQSSATVRGPMSGKRWPRCMSLGLSLKLFFATWLAQCSPNSRKSTFCTFCNNARSFHGAITVAHCKELLSALLPLYTSRISLHKALESCFQLRCHFSTLSHQLLLCTDLWTALALKAFLLPSETFPH